MTSKKVLQFTNAIERIGERFISLSYLGKGTAVILASNVFTQLCQSAWKYCVAGAIHILRSTHDGAANRARVMLGLRESDEITEKQRHVLLSGLLASRMSPNRAGLLAALIWKALSPGDKAVVLKACFTDVKDRKAHAELFNAIAEFADYITEEPPERTQRRSTSTKPTFSNLSFASEDKAAGGVGRRVATVEDASKSVEAATQ